MMNTRLVKNLFILLMLLFAFQFLKAQNNIIRCNDGKVSFLSEAPLETIRASSSQLKGLIDKQTNKFAFSIDINSFKGFNNDLQREHFHENYMETSRLPTASFSGKFIDQINYAEDAVYTVRAKGMFTIHGVSLEKIIKGSVQVSKGKLEIISFFSVKLEDYDIKVPKIVYEKIAEEIKVSLTAVFKN